MGMGRQCLRSSSVKPNLFQNTNFEKNTSGRYILCSQNEKENIADSRRNKSRKGYQGAASLVLETQQAGLRGHCDRPERSRKGGGHNLLGETQGQARCPSWESESGGGVPEIFFPSRQEDYLCLFTSI